MGLAGQTIRFYRLPLLLSMYCLYVARCSHLTLSNYSTHTLLSACTYISTGSEHALSLMKSTFGAMPWCDLYRSSAGYIATL